MTVFDLLGRIPDDSRVLELAEPLAALNAEFPGLAPKEYRGEPGRALDHIEEQLAAIVRIEEEMELVRDNLHRSFLTAYPGVQMLEVSGRSPLILGAELSAFRLEPRTYFYDWLYVGAPDWSFIA